MYKKTCLLLGALFVLDGCQYAQKKPEETRRQDVEIVIATYDPNTLEIKDIFRELFRQTFPDGTPITNITVKREGQVFYLFREGTAHNTRVITRIELIDDKRGNLILKPLGDSHTCTGNPCSSCVLTKSVPGDILGCTCRDQDPTHFCNHTISRPGIRDILFF